MKQRRLDPEIVEMLLWIGGVVVVALLFCVFFAHQISANPPHNDYL